jgi:hypothetical protein
VQEDFVRKIDVLFNQVFFPLVKIWVGFREWLFRISKSRLMQLANETAQLTRRSNSRIVKLFIWENDAEASLRVESRYFHSWNWSADGRGIEQYSLRRQFFKFNCMTSKDINLIILAEDIVPIKTK